MDSGLSRRKSICKSSLQGNIFVQRFMLLSAGSLYRRIHLPVHAHLRITGIKRSLSLDDTSGLLYKDQSSPPGSDLRFRRRSDTCVLSLPLYHRFIFFQKEVRHFGLPSADAVQTAPSSVMLRICCSQHQFILCLTIS